MVYVKTAEHSSASGFIESMLTDFFKGFREVPIDGVETSVETPNPPK